MVIRFLQKQQNALSEVGKPGPDSVLTDSKDLAHE